jgi:hypothetical protein
MNSKTFKSSKKSKTLKLNKIVNEKKLYKYNKIVKNKKDENKIKTKKVLKNKKGGGEGGIVDLQNQYSSDNYQEAGLFDFMKIKTNAFGNSSSSNPPEMPSCCIS